jgi:hypothetical protein
MRSRRTLQQAPLPRVRFAAATPGAETEPSHVTCRLARILGRFRYRARDSAARTAASSFLFAASTFG